MGSSSNNTAIFLKGFQLAVGVMILQIAGFLLVPNVCPATTPTSLAPTKKKKREGPPSTTTTATPHHVSSWSFKFKKLVTCMFDGGKAQEILNPTVVISKGSLQRRSWIDCSGSGLCNIRDVAHGNTRVMHRSETEISSVVVHDDESGSCTRTRTLTLTQDDHSNHPVGGSSSLRFSRGMHLTRWSGCYECRMIVDPIQALSTFPATIFACSSCGQIFTNSDALEQHQAIKHAVSELGEEDSARTVVDIIFQSSWLKKENPVCKIERILKIHNSQKSINKFEEYRDMVKAKANKVAKKHPRCIADGNELLRFHCTTLACSLGMNGCCSLCNQPSCTMCNVITHGFSSPPPTEEILEAKGKGKGKGNASGIGIYTTASSGKAHDHIQLLLEEENDQELLTSKVAKGKRKRAMLVCRVIAGRVQKSQDPDDFIAGGFDSIAGEPGLYSNLEELFVYNPRAVLPCFVVIYHTDCPHLTHTTPHSTALTASIFYKQK